MSNSVEELSDMRNLEGQGKVSPEIDTKVKRKVLVKKNLKKKQYSKGKVTLGREEMPNHEFQKERIKVMKMAIYFK